ncbi:MAG: FKBP-type peptidyl-prolyl cis-trans isomerase [Paludibacter sp.]|jgi:FKBP-type peptidyl-prolyl cis-trans isomerase FklB|nr:FKBP-type peptidyl-prolyl cis-trans isomerase [Paludibacter sp.]
MQKVSYALGLSLGSNLLSSNVKSLDFDEFTEGIKAIFEHKEPKISIEEAQSVLNDFFTKIENESSAGVKAQSAAFLEQNKQNPNVVALPSGLQYEILSAGTGATPKASDTVEVHYHGTLPDGTVFDSSVARGTPATFGVTQVIQGWVEALQLMPTGSKWRLFIPSDLAYGARGAGSIPPHAALIFDVELLGIK